MFATNVANIQRGVNTVFLTAGVITLVGLALTIFMVKPLLEKQEKEEKLANV